MDWYAIVQTIWSYECYTQQYARCRLQVSHNKSIQKRNYFVLYVIQKLSVSYCSLRQDIKSSIYEITVFVARSVRICPEVTLDVKMPNCTSIQQFYLKNTVMSLIREYNLHNLIKIRLTSFLCFRHIPVIHYEKIKLIEGDGLVDIT